MTLRQTIQAAPEKTGELIAKLSATSNQAVKTRETLFAQLGEELARYVEIEEQHFLPLLRKHPETKELAVAALNGNKELRSSLAKLADLPKDNDQFLAELSELNKGFQQHVRNERKELLPAVLNALSKEEAEALVTNIKTAAAETEQAKRDAKQEEAAQVRRQVEEAQRAAEAERQAARAEKREEAAQAKRQAEEAEQAAAAKLKRDEKREERAQAKREAEEAEQAAAEQRAAVRAQKAAERSARDAAEKVVDSMSRGAVAVQDSAREVTANLQDRAQQVVLEARETIAAYSESTRKIADDLKVVTASSAVSVEALPEVRTAWMEWFSKAARTNVEASQQLIRCRSVKQVAELQQEYLATAMRNWMETSTKVLEITQHTSKQALRPLNDRLSETA